MEPLAQHDPRVERANALYWESGRSVNRIADDMEVSKGMLYGLIHPLSAGLPCPDCSSDMEYANRTARDRGFLTCSSCGSERDEEQVRSQWSQAGAEPAIPTGAPPAPPGRRPHDPLVLGAGLLLVAAGLWLFRGLSRR